MIVSQGLMSKLPSNLILLRMAFGAGLAVPVGFLLYAIAYGAQATSFRYWFFHSITNAVEWGLYGAAMGALWHLISRRNSD
jgi:hypothetical protein